MNSHTACEEPPSQLARAVQERAPSLVVIRVDARDRLARMTLRAWLEAVPVLRRRQLTAATRARLSDGQKICAELDRVLAGRERGEGRAAERTIHLAVARGRVQGVASMFACPAATFVELLASAPWNVLGPDDPPDPRTVRGAGTALIEAAVEWSRSRGSGGRVALQADNRRALAFYERRGFCRMRREDAPLLLVPRGEGGWSPEILRIAGGRAGGDELCSPWLLLDPWRGRARDATVATAGVPSGRAAGSQAGTRWHHVDASRRLPPRAARGGTSAIAAFAVRGRDRAAM